MAQFFGHTHQDEFEIFYDTDYSKNSVQNLRPTNVAFIGPSLTTYGNVNPGFRIYTIDGNYEGSTYQILDHSTYYLNLTEANIHRDLKPIEYILSYSALKEFQMTDLTPEQWHNLIVLMKQDNSLFEKFYKFLFNRSENIGDNHCNGRVCKRNILCRLVSALSHDNKFCKKIL
jgi:sphingomyelin phosphodiesterase